MVLIIMITLKLIYFITENIVLSYTVSKKPKEKEKKEKKKLLLTEIFPCKQKNKDIKTKNISKIKK